MSIINARHKTEAWIAKKSQDMSPEKTKMWIELKPNHKHRIDRKVSVVYYLSQNGLLEQPHFIEVPLSSPEGLYLRGKSCCLPKDSIFNSSLIDL